jgi:hypothetical protein
MNDPILPGARGGAVVHVHRRLVVLGIEVPASELREDRFGPGTEVAIRRLQAELGLPVTGVVDAATAQRLGLPGTTPRVVQGIVCKPDGTPLPGVAVQLVQPYPHGDAALAEAKSGTEGEFTLAWPAGVSGELKIRASSGEAEPVPAGSPGGTAWVRLSVGGEYRGVARFTALTAALTPALHRGPAHALGGHGRASELKEVAAATGVPVPDVSRFELAHKLSEQTKVDPAAFFALFARRIPAPLQAALEPDGEVPAVLDDVQVARVLDTILQLRPETIETALRDAARDNVVAGLDLAEAAARLRALRLESIAALPFRVGKTPLRDVLATVVPNRAAQNAVIEAYEAHGTDKAFWTALEASGALSAEARDALRFTLRTAVLLRNHLPLLKRVQAMRAEGMIASTADLAWLDAADWGALIRETDPTGEGLTFTANLKFETLDERLDHFAHLLAGYFERRHPTAAFAGRVGKHGAELALTAPGGVQRFLDRSPAFSLRRTHIDRYLRDRPDALSGIEERAKVVADLKKVQRVYKLAPRFAHARVMLAGGFTSAHAVYATGRKRFVAAMTASGATAKAARAIYARATQAHAMSLTLLGAWSGSLARGTPSAVAEPLSAAAIAPLVADFPSLQSLFGSADYCSCEHCRAIHGPAAYLVDILEFLRHRAASGGTTRDVLFERRPDLGQIELSCDNTNGVLPYIDLACEVIEDAVSAPSPADVRARQTSGTAEELRAHPRFVNEAAYAVLRAAVYPAVAPFDLWTEEIRAYLRQLGVAWHDLLAAFQVPAHGATPATPTDAEIAGARLGFNRAALTLVVDTAPASPWAYWRLGENGNTVPDPRKPGDPAATVTGTWIELLAFVPIVLERAGLTHRELIQLLATRFVNPGGAISIVETSPDGFAHCDVSQQTVTGWTAAALVRVQQFLRLWRRVGAPIWELDKVLTSPGVGMGVLDETALAELGRFHEGASRLGLPWAELLGLWADLDHVDYVNVLDDAEPAVPSVYARRFRNATVTQSSTVFVADTTALHGDLGGAEVTAGIAAALSLSADDILCIRAAAGLAAPGTPLNLANLSVLFRYAALSGALHLSVAELIVAIAVTGVDPFASPGTTLAFLAGLDQARDSGFTLRELHYLLRHGSVLDSGIALADSTIAGSLADLRMALARGGGEALVVQRVADLLALDPELTRLAMSATLPGATEPIAALFRDPRLVERAGDGSFVVPSDRASFGGIFDAFVVLHKLRTVLARWRVGTRDAAWLLRHAGEALWLELRALPAGPGTAVPLSAFADLRTNVRLQQTLVSPSEARLFDVVARRAAPRDEVAAALAALGGWAASDVIALADHAGWTTGVALVTGGTAGRIRDLLAWPRKLGTDVATALTFVTTAATPALARQARQLAKAKYALSEWYAVSGAVQDGIREQKRAALIAWLLANPNAARGQRWASVEELYGFCLIDPEMSAWALTTRIKQAASSVQLFVQRCLLQREPRVTVNAAADDGWAQWDWMKRFRLWEANRKIFLYPENWIDPSQRRAKSPFFIEIEAALRQGDMTSDAAEEALLDYLHKLSDVSHLEIVGVCEQTDYGRRLLHVVGRTRKAPHVYYYRRLGSTGVWAPWGKIDAEIDGDHVMPVYWNRRLHVFWPTFAEKQLPTSAASRTVPSTGGGTSPEPSPYWEISLAWVEKRRERWMPKRLASRVQLAPHDERRIFVLKAPTMGRRLTIDLYRAFTSSNVAHYAQWQLTGGEDEPVLLHSGLATLAGVPEARYIDPLPAASRKPPLVSSVTLDWDYNALTAAPGVVSTLSLIEGSPQQDLAVLLQIARPVVMGEHQDPQFASQSPFFVSDAQRTFYVTPSFLATTVYSRSVPSGETTYTTQYAFAPFYHPFVDTFLQELAFGGVDGLYARRLQLNPDSVRGTGAFDFAAVYKPTAAVRKGTAPDPVYPIETIDYSHGGAYAAYNWELFFHIPFLIAKRLADNQRFEEALSWFHYIFNPTATTGGAAPQRYWIPRMFYDLTAADYAKQQIEKLLALISSGDAELTEKVAAWRADPFDPHLVASSRPVAYQKAVVMQYISTLIAWGDQLFRADTIESINEATQLYVTANELLGPRPKDLRAQKPRAAKTYAELAPQLDAFSNVLVDIENVISVPPPGGPPATAPLPQLHTFYFCIPPNEQLLGYWDTVADRLFKIRSGLNIEGVARPLALYEPPIDPGLLARAAASGIDVGAALSDVNAALPPYRFARSLQAALDLCQEVRGLGAAILSALERRDAEDMARVRATQELALLETLRAVKANALADAKAARATLETGRDMAVIRRDYYASREFVNAAELTGLVLSGAAVTAELAATLLDALASAAYLAPSFTAGAAGFGGSPMATVTHGGGSFGNSASAAASILRGVASTAGQGGNLASLVGSYQRRREEWDLQRRIAEKEIVQLERQLVGAELRIAMAEQELAAHERQIEDARTASELLATKFTNRELYDWMLSQLSTTYFQAYQLAYDLAKRASKAYAFELDGVDPGFVQFGYWDSLHRGLCAGDKLMLDLRRLEAEYLQRNRRELELTKHVPLTTLDPAALVKLRQTGACFINLPESLFDLDYPGHYMRRLRSVSVTLPCVTGPYAGVNATLTLLTHATRRSADPGPQYLPATDADGVPLDSDPRFARGTGAVASVALSTGRDDAGLFEVSFHDERYLPFEGLGAISHWRLELPRDCNRFDVSTLTDVVLHLRYTARDGGAALRDAARQAVTAALPRAGTLLLSARTDFPDAWARFWAPVGTGQRLELALDKTHFPYMASTEQLKLRPSKAILIFAEEATYEDYAAAGAAGQLKLATGSAFAPDAAIGHLPVAPLALDGEAAPLSLELREEDIAAAAVLDAEEAAPDGAVHHRLDRGKVSDILVLMSYRVEARP